MALLGISLLIASLSFCFFRWSPTPRLSFSRRLPSLKEEPPPANNNATHNNEKQGLLLQDSTIQSDASHESYTLAARSRDPEHTQDVQETAEMLPNVAASTKPVSPHTTNASTRDTPSIELPEQDSKAQELASSPPARSESTKPRTTTASQLMPPPPRPSKALKSTIATPSSSSPAPSTSSSTANSLRPPTLGPAPNRTASLTPNPRSAPKAAPTTSTLPIDARPRKKVILSPGHSPLDWAHLINTSPPTALSGVPALQRITPSQLAIMNGRKGRSAWSSYKGRIYNIRPYLPFHPGGEGELMRGAGKEAGKLFEEVHPWVNWEGMMGACLVGVLVAESGT